MADDAPLTPTPAPGPPPAPRAGGRGWRVAAWVGGGLLALLLAVALVLQTDWGRSRLLGIALGQIQNLLTEEATVTAERLGGNPLTGVRLVGLAVEVDGETAITVDTAWVDYSLLTLLQRTFAADEVRLVNPRVIGRQYADGAWNLGDILAPNEDTTGGPTPWTVEVAEALVEGGRFEAHYFNRTRDSTLLVEGLALSIGGFYFAADTLSGQVDTLMASVTPAARPAPKRLDASGAFTGTRVALNRLRLTSAASDVEGAGAVDWSGEALAFDVDLVGRPLAFADVRDFVPALPLHGSPQLTLQAQGTPQEILARLDARWPGGGVIDLNGTFAAGGDGPVRYRATGEVRDLDPAAILANPAMDARLTGELDVDLAGETLETVSGPFSLQLRGSRYGEQRIDRVDLSGRATDGRLQFTLAAAVPGARGQARGTARPFATTPTYDVSGDIAELDLATLTGDPAQTGRFRGTFRLDGQGFDPEQARAEAVVDLRDSQLGEARFERARVNATLARGLLTFRADAELGGGDGGLLVIGDARPFAAVPTYTVTSGELRSLDLAALTGDTTHTDLTGTFTLSGRGLDAAARSVEFTARLRNSAYADYRIGAADVEGTLRGDELRFAADAELARQTDRGVVRIGGVDARGGITLGQTLRYDVRGRVRGLDLAGLTGNPARSSDLTGAFTLDGAGTDPETLAANLQLNLEAGRYQQQDISGGTVTARLRGGVLDLTADLTTPEGAFTLALTGNPFGDNPTLALSEGTFSGVNLALVLGNPALQTSLNGRLELDASGGLDPRTGRIDARVALFESTINGETLTGGEVEALIDRGRVDAAAALTFAQGEAGLRFAGRPLDEVDPSYRLDGFTTDVDLAGLLGDSLYRAPQAAGPDRLTMRFEAEGTGLDPRTAEARATVEFQPSRVVGVQVDTLAADLALARSVLAVDRFRLRADFADARASGQVALFEAYASTPTDLTLTADVRTLDPLNAFLAQRVQLERGEVRARAYGEGGAELRFDVDAAADRVVYGQYRIVRLDTRTLGTYGDSLTFRTRTEFAFLSAGDLLVEGGDITATYTPSDLAAQGEVTLDRRRDLDFRLRTDLHPERDRVTLEAFNFNLDGERWELLQEATLDYGGPYRVRNLLLYSDDQQIAADGVIDLDSLQNFVVTLDNVRLDPVTDLVGYGGLGGRLSGSVDLTGPATAPDLEGALVLDSLTSAGRLVGDGRVALSYDDRRLDVNALLTHATGRTFRAEGFLPMDLTLRAAPEAAPPSADVEFIVEADSFPIAWVEPFLNPQTVDEIGGALVIPELIVTGTQSSPQLQGSARLVDGRLGLVAVGRTYQGVNVPIRFEDNRAVIEGAEAGVGGNGRLRADGAITLEELSLGAFDLAITMDDFRATNTDTYAGLRLDTRGRPLQLTGTTAQPVLTGAVTVASGDIFLTEELTGPDLEEVTLTAQDIETVESRFGIRVTEADTAVSLFYQNLTLDLGIVLDRNVWVRSRKNPQLDIELTGDFTARKQPGAEALLRLFGSIDVVENRSTIEVFGREFRIQAGRLVFNGPVEETYIDIEAGFEVPSQDNRGTAATILVAFEGRLSDNPTVSLSANPPMENTDIVSYIATGRPASAAFQGGGGGVQGLAVGQLASVVEGLARNGLGLDVVKIDQLSDGSYAVTVGTYLTSRLFGSVSQPVTPAQGAAVSRTEDTRLPELALEYELLPAVQLRLQRRNLTGYGGTFLFEFTY